MADRAGTLERLALELAGALRGLSGALHPDAVLETLARLGVAFPEELLEDAGFDNARQNSADAAAALQAAIESLLDSIASGNVASITAGGLDLLAQSSHVLDSLDGLRDQLQAAGPGLPGVSGAQVNALTADLPRKLLDSQIVSRLDIQAGVGGAVSVLGLVERTFHPRDPEDQTRPEWEEVRVRYDRISGLLGNPAGHFQDIYGWGGPGFDGLQLFQIMERLLAHMGLPVLLQEPGGGQPLTLEAFAFDLRPTSSGNPPGIEAEVVMPVSGNLDETFELPHPDWSARVKGSFDLDIGTQAEIRPPLSIQATPPGGQITGEAEMALEGHPEEPFVLLGQAGGSRLEVGLVEASAGFRLQWDAGEGQVLAHPQVAGRIGEGKLVIDASGADSFIERILSGVNLESNFDVGLRWDMQDGLSFDGSATLEIAIPAHVDLGPVELPTVYIVSGFEDGAIPLELAADVKTQLGPLTAVVNQIGAGMDLSFPEGGGNVGPAQLDFRFKFPVGVGLSIDGGGFKGGGFLLFDRDNERYAGVLELGFSELVTLKAVGLITTRLPDGTKGFSLLVIISAEFTPIQLGFGFTLNGVGGLFGLNRTAKLDVLRSGIQGNTLSSVLFPQDVVANAMKIISDLRQIFPPEEDRFVFGPMAKIGWGTPTLITLDLGLIIEVPVPLRIALLGILKVVLPDERLALIRIQVNFMGSWEQDKQLISFDAALYDSRMLHLTLAGSMALRLGYGNNPNFLLSVGGFHPAYQPPPLSLPQMTRILINLVAGNNPRLVLEAYFAVTSNTVQVGARLELEAKAWKFRVVGFLAFDVLFQFSPFYLIAEMSAGVAVKAGKRTLFSINLSLSVEGPTPWTAVGKASFKILRKKIKVRINKTWGEKKDTVLPDIAVVPLLIAALSDSRNWEARLPDRSSLLVSLRETEDLEDGAIVAHPAGTLTVVQKVVPLDHGIDTFGSQKPSDGNRFSIDQVHSDGSEFDTSEVEEFFAPAQFEAMDDSKKLSRRSFEKMEAGVRLRSSGRELHSSRVVAREVSYESIIIDNRFPFLHFVLVWFEPVIVFLSLLKGGAAARSRFSAAAKEDPLGPGQVKVSQPGFTVVSTDDLIPFDGKSRFASEAGAQGYLRQLRRHHPALRRKLQVVPDFEAKDAA